MSLLLSDSISGVVQYFPVINTLIIVCGTIVALMKLKETLDDFKRNIESISKAHIELDKRVTVIETLCEVRHSNRENHGTA